MGTPSKTNVVPGESGVDISAEDGFGAKEDLEITFESDPVSLGSVVSNDSGGFATTVTIPTSATAGSHKIVVEGPNDLGGTHTVTFPVTVVAVAGAVLPATGAGIALMAFWALFLLVFGTAAIGIAAAKDSWRSRLWRILNRVR